MATATVKDILSAEEVAERWGVDVGYVWDQVDADENGLAFLYLGKGTPTRNHKRRGLYRFRLADVEAWEANSVRSFRSRAESEDIKAVAGLSTFGHDGKVRGGRKGKAGPRGKK